MNVGCKVQFQWSYGGGSGGEVGGGVGAKSGVGMGGGAREYMLLTCGWLVPSSNGCIHSSSSSVFSVHSFSRSRFSLSLALSRSLALALSFTLLSFSLPIYTFHSLSFPLYVSLLFLAGRQLLPVREVWRARDGAAAVRDKAAAADPHRAPEAFRVRS